VLGMKTWLPQETRQRLQLVEAFRREQVRTTASSRAPQDRQRLRNPAKELGVPRSSLGSATALRSSSLEAAAFGRTSYCRGASARLTGAAPLRLLCPFEGPIIIP
jgi:hypothetical protein